MLTGALVTAADPVAPEIVVGPVAVRIQAVATAVPPLVLVTVLIRVRCAGWSSLLMVQVMFALSGTVRVLPVSVPPPVQDQAPAR